MGIGGSKWVTEPFVRVRFVEMLERLQSQPDAEVQFLLINPSSEAVERLNKMRNEGLHPGAFKYWLDLCEEFSCLRVKLYNHLPCFRLVFIDDTVLAVSHYQMTREEYIRSRAGWKAPHLVLKRTNTWSLFNAFKTYWQEEWEAAMEITTENAEAIEAINKAFSRSFQYKEHD